jgi:hypothetical protein
MNKTLKTILIIINVIALLISTYWFYKEHEPHPFIVILDEVATLIALIFEKQVCNILSKRVHKSDIDVNVISGDNITTKDITESSIRIKTKK